MKILEWVDSTMKMLFKWTSFLLSLLVLFLCGGELIGGFLTWVQGQSGSLTDTASEVSAYEGMLIALVLVLSQVARLYRLFFPSHPED